MRRPFFIFLVLSFHAVPVQAQSQKTALDPDTVFDSATKKGKGEKSDLVEAIYETCMKHIVDSSKVAENPDFDTDFDRCVRDELAKDPGQVKKFREEVGRGTERSPIRRRKSGQRKQLTQYLRERFDQKVRKGENDNQDRFIDHALFFEFYQSQLSKTVTIVINTYCMYADEDTDEGEKPRYLLANQGRRNAVFEANRDKLIRPDDAASRFFSGCASSITHICHGSDSRIDDHSKREACQVLANLRNINRALTANEKRINYARCRGEFKGGEHCREGGFRLGGGGGIEANLEFYDPTAKGQTIDDLTSFTASEFQKNVIDKIEESCDENAPPDEKCLKQLEVISSEQQPGSGDEGEEENDKKVLAEYRIQTLIVSDGFDNVDDEKEDLVRKIASEGADEETIQEVEKKSDDEIKKIRQKMRERYERERQASLEKLAARFSSRKSGAGQTPLTTEQVVADIRRKNRNVGQLLFFNNVISGYLEVRDGEEENEKGNGQKPSVQRNLASFEREVSQANEEGASPAGTNASTAGGIQSLGIDQEFVGQLGEKLKDLKKQGEGGKDNSDPVHNPTFKPRDVYDQVLQDPDAYDIPKKSKQKPNSNGSN